MFLIILYFFLLLLLLFVIGCHKSTHGITFEHAHTQFLNTQKHCDIFSPVLTQCALWLSLALPFLSVTWSFSIRTLCPCAHGVCLPLVHVPTLCLLWLVVSRLLCASFFFEDQADHSESIHACSSRVASNNASMEQIVDVPVPQIHE